MLVNIHKDMHIDTHIRKVPRISVPILNSCRLHLSIHSPLNLLNFPIDPCRKCSITVCPESCVYFSHDT